MLKKHWFLFLVLITEGSSLMAVELMGAKLLAPFYGSSLYVWTAVLSITVLGLSLGYFTGGLIAAKHATGLRLVLIIGIAALLVFLLPATAARLIALTSQMGLIPGICTASFFLLVPPMFCFGLVGPIVVKLMVTIKETLGNVAGTVYFTSTLGGIAATFLFGFYLIPESGLIFCARTTAAGLAALPVIYLFAGMLSLKSKSITPPAERDALYPLKPAAECPLPAGTLKSVYLFAAVEGAAVMAVELLSARMLAPYFGSSLYVWVAVIGITLLSLAIGYFAGGKLADRHTGIETIYMVLLAASLFIVSMHFLTQYFTVALMQTDLSIALLLVCVLLITPPLLFLGMVPTLLIRFLTSNIESAGTITGRVFTISSASGIIAMPLLGFYLIPRFGLSMPSILTGIIVGIIPFILLLAQKKYIALFFAACVIFSFSQRKVASTSAAVKVVSFSEGLLGQVLVADILKNPDGKVINERILMVNRIGQTFVNNRADSSNWSYINYTLAIAGAFPPGSKVLVLGLGGGSVANRLYGMNLLVDAVELDERIARIARTYFALNPAVQVFIDDARHYLETTTQKYDLIFFDTFKGEQPPPHVLSLECFRTARTLLNAKGLIVVNFNGFLKGDIGKPGRSVYATLKAAGFHTLVLPTPGEEAARNTLFVAATTSVAIQPVQLQLLQAGFAVDSVTKLPRSTLPETTDAYVFTDNKPDLDRINMQAATSWRKGYNVYYARFFLTNGLPLFN